MFTRIKMLSATSSGSPCKLCKKKGGLCHIHSKSSPKSSPVRELPKEFHYLKDLPSPALEVVLMHMDGIELKEICSTLKKAKEICDLPRFKEKYSALHPKKMFFFKGKVAEDWNNPVQGNMYEYNNYTLQDGRGNRINIRLFVYKKQIKGIKYIELFSKGRQIVKWEDNWQSGLHMKGDIPEELSKQIEEIQNVLKIDRPHAFYEFIKKEIEMAGAASGKPSNWGPHEFRVFRFFGEID